MLTLRRLLLGGTAAAVIVAAAAIAGWWFFLRSTSTLATSAPAIPADLRATAGSATPSGGALAFQILPDRSEAAYFADEKLASLPLPSKAKGATSDIQGTFYLTPDGLGLDPSRPSTFTVKLATLKSDKSQRDHRVQVALDTADYPTATFTASAVSGYDPSLPPDQEQDLPLTGVLDLRGVQRQVTWDVKGRRSGNLLTALATLKVNFGDFSIPSPNIAGFVSVQDTVTLQVQVVAQAS